MSASALLLRSSRNQVLSKPNCTPGRKAKNGESKNQFCYFPRWIFPCENWQFPLIVCSDCDGWLSSDAMVNRALCVFLFLSVTVWAQGPSPKEVDAVYSDAHTLYLDLHEHPELSGHEMQTAAKLAARLREAGFEVTEHIGGTGFVALLKNGSGPTIMLRTELDALPVEEKTGLPYASKVRTKDDAGHDVPAMHACGHDVHM